MSFASLLKIGGIVIAVVAVIGIIIAAGKSNTPEPTPTILPTRQPRMTIEPTQQVEPTATPKEISYIVFKQWSLETGAGSIVIPKEYLNDADMAALGEKLKHDYASEKNVNIRVFSDNEAAKLYDKVIAEKATAAEDALYTKNFVGWYKKNGNNGYHEFDTFINGVLGEHKPISY